MDKETEAVKPALKRAQVVKYHYPARDHNLVTAQPIGEELVVPAVVTRVWASGEADLLVLRGEESEERVHKALEGKGPGQFEV